MKDNQRSEWNASFKKKDNYLFYPHEEIIRFASKYIRKKVGLTDFLDVDSDWRNSKILDLGCGIGRHVIFFHHLGLDCYGVDLSKDAVSFARRWGNRERIQDVTSHFVVSDIRNMPFQNEYFRYVVSHGVLDSMHFEIAQKGVIEVSRIMMKGGLFYVDLIAPQKSLEAPLLQSDEVLVSGPHEESTIQSYFDLPKIHLLFDGLFEIKDHAILHRYQETSGISTTRHHLVLERI